jgi:hypothetical protein
VPQKALLPRVILSDGAKRRVEGALYFAFAIALVFSSDGCNRKPYAPTRPVGIGENAVYIQGPDGRGSWQSCSFVEARDYCQIWTVSGAVLERGFFVPYGGGSVIPQQDLLIVQQGGAKVIKLKNGHYLIPETGSGHEAAIRYLDFMTGKTKSFDSKKESTN